MNDIFIREAVIGDNEVIYRLNKEELGYDYPEAEALKNLEILLSKNSEKIFIAEYDGIPAGYIHASDYRVIYAPAYKNILGIAVFSEYKRKGVGSALLAAAENWAAETGASGIRLCSGEMRTGAHKFYEANGYISNKKQLNFKKSF